MASAHILVSQSDSIHGTVELSGAKNAVLVIIASLILTEGKSVLTNVPHSADVQNMISLLAELGAQTSFDQERGELTVDTSTIYNYEVKPEIMNKMRASILVMGPLLARFGKAKVAMPGGCLIGARPINYHLQGFKHMGVVMEEQAPFLLASIDHRPHYNRIVLEYPSVGATENLMMLAALGNGQTDIINAALEPEVLDLVDILRNMGADITINDGLNIYIKGVATLAPVKHAIIPDRLEAGGLLLAACITKGSIHLPDARPDHMDLFLGKLREMGHEVIVNVDPATNKLLPGITLTATQNPRAVSFKTNPYPGFPTDLQAPMMALLCLADGTSVVEETVFENRMMHVSELQKMGAQITVDRTVATIRGVDQLYGSDVIASDIRASCALVLAGLAAQGTTRVTGIHHWRRGYDSLDRKLKALGCSIQIIEE